MNMYLTNRRRRAPLIVVSAILCFLATSSPTIAQGEGMLFDGAAFGSTEESAIRGAIGDAEDPPAPINSTLASSSVSPG